MERLRAIARIALDEFEGDLRKVVKQAPEKAKKALRLFPGIGDPGAEKILLFSRSYPALALESNGLRALVRLGFGEASKNYSTTYRSAQEAAKGQLQEDCRVLIRAHQLLRRHGQELCRRSAPSCEYCPLQGGCRYYREGVPSRLAF
ncbi:MAG TPA: hypothetical protein VKM93_23565 [Terriglobia bacterium]|nr:hypothetical protein [Terriglobia bacterium]